MKNFSLHILYSKHMLLFDRCLALIDQVRIDLMKYFIFIFGTSYFKNFFRLKLIGKNYKNVPPQLQNKAF